MDIKEASAMTEASGLTDDQDGHGRTSRMPGSAKAKDAGPVALGLSERLRQMTVEAPLQSLFAAFLLGAWLARRR
jgi:hypothetical protein